MALKINPLTKLSLDIAKITNRLHYLNNQGQKEFIYKISNKTRFKIRVNSADKFSIWETWRIKSYTGRDFNIQPHDIVIDLGAHIGAFAVYAAQKAAQGKVYAYEPEPENFKLLKENKSLNDLANLQVFSIAVMGKSGKVKLFVEHDITSINTVLENDNPMYKQAITVPATTLKEIIKDNKIVEIDFLKIDVEGAEYDILLNTPHSVFNKIRKISLEYHDHFNHGHNVKELERYLQQQGFKTKVDNTLFMTRFLKFGLLRAWKD